MVCAFLAALSPCASGGVEVRSLWCFTHSFPSATAVRSLRLMGSFPSVKHEGSLRLMGSFPSVKHEGSLRLMGSFPSVKSAGPLHLTPASPLVRATNASCFSITSGRAYHPSVSVLKSFAAAVPSFQNLSLPQSSARYLSIESPVHHRPPAYKMSFLDQRSFFSCAERHFFVASRGALGGFAFSNPSAPKRLPSLKNALGDPPQKSVFGKISFRRLSHASFYRQLSSVKEISFLDKNSRHSLHHLSLQQPALPQTLSHQTDVQYPSLHPLAIESSCPQPSWHQVSLHQSPFCQRSLQRTRPLKLASRKDISLRQHFLAGMRSQPSFSKPHSLRWARSGPFSLRKKQLTFSFSKGMRGLFGNSFEALAEEDEEFFKILNPCTEWAFQHSLRNNPHACCNAINALLGLKEEEAFTDILFMDSSLHSHLPFATEFAIDLLAKDITNCYCLIEVKHDLSDNYLDIARTKHGRFEGGADYSKIPTGSAHSQHLRESFFSKELKGIYSLVISNRDTHPPQPEIINTYEYRHTEYLDRPLGNLPSRITFVTLAQFEKEPEELKTDLDRFLYFFKYSHHEKELPVSKMVPNRPEVVGKRGSAIYRLYHSLKWSNFWRV